MDNESKPEVTDIEVTEGEIVEQVDADFEAVLASMNLNDEQKAKLRAARKSGSRSRRVDEAEIIKKYPHVIPGTLGYDTEVNKQFVEIRCQHPGCEEKRRVFTSDLFQVKVCVPHRKEQRKAAKAERAELMAEAKKLLAARKSKATEAPKAEETPVETAEAQS